MRKSQLAGGDSLIAILRLRGGFASEAATSLRMTGGEIWASALWRGGVFFLVAGVLLLYAIIVYNELVRLRNDNDRAWANIDVLLKQRHDEMPKLVKTGEGYMQHERSTRSSRSAGAGGVR